MPAYNIPSAFFKLPVGFYYGSNFGLDTLCFYKICYFAFYCLKIVETCNAKYANQVLSKDVKISLMLPCPISVYIEGGRTYISALRPIVLADLYPQAEIKAVAEEVDKTVISIVDDAK